MRMLPALTAVCLLAAPAFAKSDSGDYTISSRCLRRVQLGGFLRFGGLKHCKVDCNSDNWVPTETATRTRFSPSSASPSVKI